MSSYDEHLISMAGGDGELETLDLVAIQARADAATKGPWFREYSDVVTAHPDPRDVEDGYEDARNARVVRGAPHLPKKDRQGIADASFIANARTDVPALLALVREQQARIGRVEALHQPVKRWEPYEGAGYSFNTREEALRASGEEDLGAVAIEAGPQFFEVCKECGRIESEQLSETGEDWGYRESLWPCKTSAALTATDKP